MNAPFQFHYRQLGIKSFEDIASLRLRWSGFLDVLFRQDLFTVLETQMNIIPLSRQVEYTFEIIIGDPDPTNDGVSLIGEVLDKTVLSYRADIPKYIDQGQLKPQQRREYPGCEYSPAARDANWLYLLKALGYYHDAIRTDALENHQAWDATYLGFFEEIEKQYPNVHHALYDLVNARDPSIKKHFIPFFDLRVWLEHPTLKHALRRVQDLYFKHRKLQIYGSTDISPSAVSGHANQRNLELTKQLLLPYYVFPSDQWWHDLFQFKDEEDEQRDFNQVLAEMPGLLVETHNRHVMLSMMDQLKTLPFYRDITEAIVGKPKQDEKQADEPTL